MNTNNIETIFKTKKEYNNLFDLFNVDSPQNNRIIIVGPSGTGKTSLLYDLIFNHLPVHRRHIYLHGTQDSLKNSIIPELKRVNIKVFEKIISNSNDSLVNLDKLQQGDLLIIDDLSDQMKSSSKLNEFLNKVFTTSRHSQYNVILIVHKFKLSNPMIRNNATKIILSGLDKELLDLFGDKIVNKDIKPIVLDPQNDFKQQKLIGTGLNPVNNKITTAGDLMKTITVKNDFVIPKFIRKNKPMYFVDINTNDEKYQYQVPPGLKKLFKRMLLKDSKLVLHQNPDPFDVNESNKDENIIIKSGVEEREKINIGEKYAGNDNINNIITESKKVFKYIPKRKAK